MIQCDVGDWVVRDLAGILMPLRVSAVTDNLIICGGDEKEHIGWWFDRKTGAEIDEDLGWGPSPEYLHTGSILVKHNGSYVVTEETANRLARPVESVQ